MKYKPFVMVLNILGILFLSFSVVSATQNEICKPSESHVQNYKLRIISQGCVQRDLLHVENIDDFTYCCDRHNACYQTCGTTKPFCDEDMKMCMHKVCKAILGDSRTCEANAESFHTAIVSSDYDDFHHKQEDYCTCHNSDDIDQYYINAIRGFYTNWAPDMVSNAEVAVKLYRNKNAYNDMIPTYAYAKLYYDLHKKYDIAIGLSPRRKSIDEFPDPTQLWKRLLS